MKRNKRGPTWFTARLLFKAEIKGRRPRKIHTFEESVLLVSGTNEREAMEKAKKLAWDKQHTYQNLYKEQVSWKFVKLLELQEILDGELGDGVEVYSNFFHKRK